MATASDAAPYAHEVLLPDGWPRPKGYANGVAASGRVVFTAGVVGWDENCRFAGGTLTAQLQQALSNIIKILGAGGAGPEHIVRLTWYILSRDDYNSSLPEIGRIYREALGKNFPAMAVVQVSGLMEAEALIEIEATAVVPA